ncbi:putative enzyme related to lactoylglutathione lyase [Thermosporothrix hazakensis]|jgi:catechol 2,3-dioxygenase-like lactoylglutathione lyase family enzyme|uniref:Glyoxalase n=2 Tax=Thermosporothrix TaxID=768650 RepID=A0A455SP23_9CHLR|nr:VOC family protein [Thermosporothrix hazakensis]PZW27095.1 putative enzyme related to lactoylglutathione lyase [Thermosporothrix hazakensis]BBH87955.1 glyoxalase [Thermosporothrix sp. COM3]GCE50380.1 glyoxalase [Thermosporothrix hazakensis]
MEFHAIRLLVNKFSESLAFYKDILGFSGWHNDTLEYAYFEEKNLALFARKRMAPVLGSEIQALSSFPLSILQFEVDDVDEVVHSLREKGVDFVTLPTDMPEWGSRVAHFCDPDGNVIELYKPIRERIEAGSE